MAGWSRILGFGKKLVNNPVTRSMGGAVVHPQRTLAGFGHATKTAVVGGGMGYLAWENIVNDKPVVRTVADVLVGEGKRGQRDGNSRTSRRPCGTGC